MILFDRLFRAIIRSGPLTVIDARGRSHVYGAVTPATRPLTIRFADASLPWTVVRNPALAMGEAYMDGRLIIEGGDIADFADLIGYNLRWDADNPVRSRSWRPRRIGTALDGWNWRRRAKRNVAHHYDLSDRLYDLFLDRDRQYSCAYFDAPELSLDEAQSRKKAHIAAKLLLRPGQRVLDIGCGWGGMALYLHEKYGVEVLGITLSEEQIKIAQERAEKAGVADKVKFQLIDYRKVEGKFDRIVSVGMYEHVGPAHYRTFAAKCRSLLTDDGVMLLHTIGRIGPPRPTDTWTTKYIFPGGYIPSMSEIARAAEATRLVQTDVETLRMHYGYTLLHWLRRTQANKDAIVAMYDERFYRMWEFYLAGSATGFFNGQMVNYQVQYVRDRTALPLTRDYMFEAEAKLRK